MTGVGMLELDIAVFMATVSAVLVNVYRLGLSYPRGFENFAMPMFRLGGWSILAVHFGEVLFATHDILISVPGAIALFFLVAGEIAALLTRTKHDQT